MTDRAEPATTDPERLIQALNVLSSRIPNLRRHEHGRWVGDCPFCRRTATVRVLWLADETQSYLTVGCFHEDGINGCFDLDRRLGIDRGDLLIWSSRANGTSPKILSAAYKSSVSAERNELRFRTAREIAESLPEETEWLSFPWLAAAAITELDGKFKASGKTTWIMAMVRAILDGADFMGHPTTKTGVIYLTEQPDASFRKALERAGLTGRDDLVVLSLHQALDSDWATIIAQSIQEAKRRGFRALVIDTVAAWAGVRGDSENDSGFALQAMRAVQRATAEGIGALMARHERKAGGDVGDSGRGSSAWGGAADIVLSIRRPEGNHRPTVREIQALSRWEETPDQLLVELTPKGYVWLGTGTQIAESEARDAILKVLPQSEHDALPLGRPASADREGNHRPATGLMALLPPQIKRTTMQTVLAALKAEEIISEVGAGVRGNPFKYFFLPELNSYRRQKESDASPTDSAETPDPFRQKETVEEEDEL